MKINLMQMCRLISLKDDQFVEIKLYYLHLKSVLSFSLVVFFFFCYQQIHVMQFKFCTDTFHRVYPTNEDNISVVQYFKFGMKYPQGVYEPFSLRSRVKLIQFMCCLFHYIQKPQVHSRQTWQARHYKEKVTACHYTPANEEYFTTALNSLEILHMLNTI